MVKLKVNTSLTYGQQGRELNGLKVWINYYGKSNRISMEFFCSSLDLSIIRGRYTKLGLDGGIGMIRNNEKRYRRDIVSCRRTRSALYGKGGLRNENKGYNYTRSKK